MDVQTARRDMVGIGLFRERIIRRACANCIVFALGLCVGIGVASFAGRFARPSISLLETANDVRRIAIQSVPETDFPNAFKRNGPTGGTVRLIAVFDADGSIKSIRPYPMVPFGVKESAAGSGEFAGVTPFMSGSKFVNSLPYGLTELAIEQVSKIEYKPMTRNGKPASQRVFVLTDYSYTDSQFSVGCSSIDVTIMDDNGVLWSGNTWASRDRGCIMI